MNKVENEFLGMNFIWFFGVVEDVGDPLKLGRVRVRCMGWHTDVLEDLSTSDLPWAQCLQPITSAAVSGVGTSPTGLKHGSWVMGFFLDGADAQQPMVMGSFAGIPQSTPDTTKGFNDLNGVFPIESYVGEPDTPRLARGSESNIDPHVLEKIFTRVTNIPTAVAPSVGNMTDKSSATYTSGRISWSEPNPRYGGQTTGSYPISVGTTYPYNTVTQTQFGHVQEVDDTPGAQRLHWYHSSGTFTEIQPDGAKVSKIVGDGYEIYAQDDNVYVKGSVNMTVVGDVKLMTKRNFYHEVGGDYFLSVTGDMVTKVGRSEIKEVGRNKSTNVGADRTENVGSAGISKIGKDNSVFVGGKNELTVTKDNSRIVLSNEAIAISGNIMYKSGGRFNMGAGSTGSFVTTSNLLFESGTTLTIVGPTRVDINPS
mgnify:FL=1